MSAPAIVSLLLPKNLRVLEAFVRRHPGTTVLSPAYAATPDARQRIAAAGGGWVAVEELLGSAEHAAIASAVQERITGLAGQLATPAWTRSWSGGRIAAAALAECLAAEATDRLPGLVPLVTALERAAALYAIGLVVVNDDVTT